MTGTDRRLNARTRQLTAVHPGNVVWSRSRLTAVGDWEAACIGPLSIDVAHCRVHDLDETPDLATDIADAWLDVTGSPFDPWAAIATIVGLLDSLRSHPLNPAARRRIERTWLVLSLTAARDGPFCIRPSAGIAGTQFHG